MNQFKRKLINWLYPLARKEIIKEFDTYRGNLILEELIKREDPNKLRRMLFEYVFPLDFKNMEERRRWEVYYRIGKATSIINLLKSRYTRAYQAFTQAHDDKEREQLRGRIMEVENLIDQAESSGDVLANWEDSQKRLREKKSRLTKYFNTKL